MEKTTEPRFMQLSQFCKTCGAEKLITEFKMNPNNPEDMSVRLECGHGEINLSASEGIVVLSGATANLKVQKSLSSKKK